MKINEMLKICKDIYDSYQPKKEDTILYKKHPHLFVLGCVMDSQIDADKAWNIPKLVAKEVGGSDFQYFMQKDEKYYIQLFKDRKYHRFNERMGLAFYYAIQLISNKYKGDASNIWNDEPTSAELVCRFLEFKNIGVKIATMAANLLTRDYKVKLKDYYSIDISPDVHVKRTMFRMGLLGNFQCDDFTNIDPNKVIYRARSLNPTFPGLMDLAFWKVGFDRICTNTKCNAKLCPFAELCIKQGVEKGEK